MVGQRIGGINVFGGGLALYKAGVRVGGLGVSGDQSCTDHMVAWRTRHALHLDKFGAVGSTAALISDRRSQRTRTTSSSTFSPIRDGTG